MGAKISVEELDAETRRKLGIEAGPDNEPISDRLVTLGRVLASLKGYSKSDGVWILSQALYAIQKEAADKSDMGVMEEEVAPIGFILYIVAQAFGYTVPDLRIRSKDYQLTEARQVAMYVLWNTEIYTQTEIGRELGGRSPATVGHGYNKIARRILTDTRLKRKVEGIYNDIRKGESGSADYLLSEKGV